MLSITYEKPLMSVYSCPIFPPWSSACFLALGVISIITRVMESWNAYAATCSGVDSGLRVTWNEAGRNFF